MAGNRVTNDGTYSYAYDEEGNLVKRTTITGGNERALIYDYRNRLVEVKDYTGTIASGTLKTHVKYEYDTLNRRVHTWTDTNGDGSSNREEFYIYDGDDVVLDFVDANGATGGLSPAVSMRYLHGPAVDQILAQEDANKSTGADDRTLWMLTDQLGSVRDLVDNAGNGVSHISYDGFGNVVGGTVLLTRYLWTGREFDATTGLQYNRNRWYDPALGRWISEDPIEFAGGDYNLSRYARNSSVNFIDSDGLATEKAMATQIARLVSTGKLKDLREAMELLKFFANGATQAGKNVMDKVLGGILSRYPLLSGGCQQAARMIQTAFENAGYKNSQIITLVGARGEKFLEFGQRTVAIHGEHDAVLLEGRVYDAISGPSGMTLAEYLALWAQNGTTVVVK